MVHRVTTSGNEWQEVVQRMTASGKTSDKKWQSDSEWQQVVQRMKMAQNSSKNGWLPFFLWQKQIHNFKGWMAAIRVVKILSLRSSKKVASLNK